MGLAQARATARSRQKIAQQHDGVGTQFYWQGRGDLTGRQRRGAVQRYGEAGYPGQQSSGQTRVPAQ